MNGNDFLGSSLMVPRQYGAEIVSFGIEIRELVYS